MVEDLGLAGLGFGDQALVEHVEDVLADRLELLLDLLTILADGRHVLVGALGFLLLLDGRDDAPGRAPSADDVLVRDREQVTLVNGQLTPQLLRVSIGCKASTRTGSKRPYLGDFLGESSVTSLATKASGYRPSCTSPSLRSG